MLIPNESTRRPASISCGRTIGSTRRSSSPTCLRTIGWVIAQDLPPGTRLAIRRIAKPNFLVNVCSYMFFRIFAFSFIHRGGFGTESVIKDSARLVRLINPSAGSGYRTLFHTASKSRNVRDVSDSLITYVVHLLLKKKISLIVFFYSIKNFILFNCFLNLQKKYVSSEKQGHCPVYIK